MSAIVDWFQKLIAGGRETEIKTADEIKIFNKDKEIKELPREAVTEPYEEEAEPYEEEAPTYDLRYRSIIDDMKSIDLPSTIKNAVVEAITNNRPYRYLVDLIRKDRKMTVAKAEKIADYILAGVAGAGTGAVAGTIGVGAIVAHDRKHDLNHNLKIKDTSRLQDVTNATFLP